MFYWTLHLNRGPVLGGQAAAVAVGDKVYSFGGYRSNDQIDVHIFNTVALRWGKLTPVTTGRGEFHLEVPSICRGHTAVLIEDMIYIWGGCKYDTRKYCNVLYAFDVDAHRWFKPKVSGTVPEERRNHTVCVLGKVMFIHGGCNWTCYHNDMYKLDTTTMVWSLINTRDTSPPASSHHSATILGTKMFVFGGGDYISNNIIRVFDTETNCWLNTPSAQLLPERRFGHSAFTYNGELYIYGGGNNNHTTLNDLWRFSPETFSWKRVEPKGKIPCGMYLMCCCIVGDRIILSGGYDRPDDLYMLDLSPSLKTLCKLAVIQYDLDQSELPHDIRWELEAMTSNT